MPSHFWIAADWGTSNLRVWRMEGHRMTAQAQSGDGMGQLKPGAFEPALLRLVAPWIAGHSHVQVLACGMVGARQGWLEAPYATVPTLPVDPASAVSVPVADPRIEVRILPGLSQANPPDVLRGEETQIAGLLLEQPGFSGLVCLPGTHCKWARVHEGRVESFRTFMTGELFALLSEHSVLRHSVCGNEWDDKSFAAGVFATRGDPAALAGALFAIRARELLEKTNPGSAKARLSGLLIGAELSSMEQTGPVASVAIIGSGKVARHYKEALRLCGIDSQELAVETATLKGLCAAWDVLKENS